MARRGAGRGGKRGGYASRQTCSSTSADKKSSSSPQFTSNNDERISDGRDLPASSSCTTVEDPNLVNTPLMDGIVYSNNDPSWTHMQEDDPASSIILSNDHVMADDQIDAAIEDGDPDGLHLAAAAPRPQRGCRIGRPRKRYVGVRQRPSGRWVAEIKDTTQKIRLWLGTFDTAEEAARAYDEAACLLRGSNTRTNFLPSSSASSSSSLPSKAARLLLLRKRAAAAAAANSASASSSRNGNTPSSGSSQQHLLHTLSFINDDSHSHFINPSTSTLPSSSSLLQDNLYYPTLPNLDHHLMHMHHHSFRSNPPNQMHLLNSLYPLSHSMQWVNSHTPPTASSSVAAHELANNSIAPAGLAGLHGSQDQTNVQPAGMEDYCLLKQATDHLQKLHSYAKAVQPSIAISDYMPLLPHGHKYMDEDTDTGNEPEMRHPLPSLRQLLHESGHTPRPCGDGSMQAKATSSPAAICETSQRERAFMLQRLASQTDYQGLLRHGNIHIGAMGQYGFQSSRQACHQQTMDDEELSSNIADQMNAPATSDDGHDVLAMSHEELYHSLLELAQEIASMPIADAANAHNSSISADTHAYTLAASNAVENALPTLDADQTHQNQISRDDQPLNYDKFCEANNGINMQEYHSKDNVDAQKQALSDQENMTLSELKRMNYERQISASLYAMSGVAECLLLSYSSGRHASMSSPSLALPSTFHMQRTPRAAAQLGKSNMWVRNGGVASCDGNWNVQNCRKREGEDKKEHCNIDEDDEEALQAEEEAEEEEEEEEEEKSEEEEEEDEDDDREEEEEDTTEGEEGQLKVKNQKEASNSTSTNYSSVSTSNAAEEALWNSWNLSPLCITT
ncbi:hypothetical protein GOP47_0029438 [Adiantum capillus-veneris]|nr:hypothetical protein GOP47_0029438 [Adiantum capillus-veneris]